MAEVFTRDNCSFCRKSGKKMKKCKKCGSVYYCSKSCMKAHRDAHSTICMGTEDLASYAKEIQKNVTKLLKNDNFIAFICPLIYQWNAFDTQHIECFVKCIGKNIFAINFECAEGEIGEDDNVHLQYEYHSKESKIYTYSMYIRFSREDCKSEWDHRKQNIFSNIGPSTVAININLMTNNLIVKQDGKS